jgi:signal transduction histidine kinase/HD-GYP domain-containing protein (c-di-GMP phosphodiesterase class II)
VSGALEGPGGPATARYRALASLSSLSFAVQSALDTKGLLAAVSEHVLDLARADYLSLLLFDYETGELDGDLFERDRRGPVGHLRTAPRPGSFLAHVLRREALVVEEPFEADGPGRDDLGWGAGVPASLVGIPILVGTSLLGVALVGYRERVRITDRRRRWLLFLADQIGLAIDRIRTRGELEAKTARLDETRQSLKRADDAKGELISVVSHELRTPLTAIKAYTETLIDNLTNNSFSMQERFLGVINDECDRLSRMVNDVLDLSRMDSGKRRLKAQPVMLDDLLEEVLPTVEPQLAEKGLRFESDLAPGLPLLEADPDLLKQVLVNLIHNAAKFTREGTVVRVRAARAGERMRIAVEDEGPGIPPDKVGRVFERFFRVESPGTERTVGTGLGLAIVKSVVELHGGSVHVESQTGHGSRFIVDLPLAQRGFRALIQSLEPFFDTPELRALLSGLVEMTAQVMESRIVSLMFYTTDGSELVIRAAYGLDSDTVAHTRVKTGTSIAGWVAQNSENLLVNDIENDRRFRKMNRPQYETKSLLCVPLRVAGETVGVVNVTSKASGADFDIDDLNLLVAIARRAGIALERARAGGAGGFVAATIQSIRAITRAKRSHALRSSRRAFKLATGLGRRLRLTEEDVEVLGYVARIHDVGMLTMGEGLLTVTRRWTDDEREQLERHPQASVQILRPMEFTSKVNEIILCHHEHYDGHGYPRGLRGESIPLPARILAVVDAFEAMTVGRPYREPVSEGEAITELKRCAGTQFDPSVVREFAELLAEEEPESTRLPGGPGSTEAHRDSVH